MNNPLLVNINEQIDFTSLKKDEIDSASKKVIENAKTKLNSLYSIEKDNRTFENTMTAIDDISNDIGRVAYPVYLLGETHPDKDIRDISKTMTAEIMKFENLIALDERLYNAVKNYSKTAEAKELNGYKARFVEETVTDFERNGFALPKEKRTTLKEYQDKLSDLSIEFSKNIAEHDDFIIAGEEEIDGLPEDFRSAHKIDGEKKYKIGLEYPSYLPFMKYSISEPARKELYTKYNNRAADKNLDVLKEMLQFRIKKSELLGYKTFAEYKVENRMAKLPKTVWDFEKKLAEKAKKKAKADLAELLEIKKSHLNGKSDKKKNSADVINPWENAYFANILLKKKYDLDQEKLKEYFELDKALEGLFEISQILFDIEFKEVENPSVWHQDVRMFNVFQSGELISSFYLDLFPRDNKYSHAACFPMIKGKQTPEGYQRPLTSLVCNFPKPTKEQPSLLPHSQVETLFHEFGHLLHNVLTKSQLFSYSGTSVKRDFVETPSQLLENWTWDYETLCLFARHYKTNEVLPREMFDKLSAAKNMGSGIGTMTQICYGLIDFTLHDGYDPDGDKSTTDIVKELYSKYIPFPFLDGTHFHASFGHLAGYEAGYYGYLWARVFAQDVFSIFEKEGLLNKETGVKLRETIMAPGGDEDPLGLVRRFLGREPNNDAFIKWIGLEG